MLATPTEIEYFIETYRTKHISKAAMRLGVTQPTLTQSLQKLEDKLGVDLFFRTKQGVVPTTQGTLFFAKAHTLLDSWNDINETVLSSNLEIRGRFRVGCHQSVGMYTIPILLKHLNTHAPGIEIDLVHDFSRKITERIVSYDIDIGYVINPARHQDLVLKKLGTDRVLFWKKRGVANPPKRLFTDANMMQVEDMLGRSFKKDFVGWSLVQSSSLELIRTMTMSGEGVGILPSRVASRDDADLVIFDQNLPTYHDEIYLAYRKDVLSNNAGRELVKRASFQL